MSGRLIILTDLDDTLFASERSLPQSIDSADLIEAAVNDQGQAVSWQTVQHRRLMQALFKDADVVVPVTGRTSRVLKRVGILVHDGPAISSHGGVVLDQGQLVLEWFQQIETDIATESQKLEAAMRAIEEASKILQDAYQPRYRLHEDQGIPVYASIKTGTEIDRRLSEQIHSIAASHDLYAHVGIRNAALLPSYTRKDRACTFVLDHLLKRTAADTVITLGDSLSDLPFMALGDFAVQPTQSQIWQTMRTY